MGIALLLLFALSASGLAPTLVGLCAKWDGGHGVALIRGVAETSLVLSHEPEAERNRMSYWGGHEHSGLTEWVVLLSVSGGADEDHVIRLHGCPLRVESGHSREDARAPDVGQRLWDASPSESFQRLGASSAGVNASSSGLARLRTVVLLI